MTFRVSEPTPSETGYGDVQQDHYTGPESGGTSYQKGYRSSFERSGGAFTTKGLTQGHVVGLSTQSRSSLINWGDNPSPSFTQN
jgi:hypothetical protein